MKKFITVTVVFLCALMLFTSCQSAEEPVTEAESEILIDKGSADASDTISLNVLAEKAKTDIHFGEDLESQEDAGISIYRMADLASASCGFCGSATAEQIVLFAVNDGAMDSAKEAANTQLNYLAENYASYAPDEVPKLKNAVVKNYGDILVVCVSSDSDAEAKLDNIFA